MARLTAPSALLARLPAAVQGRLRAIGDEARDLFGAVREYNRCRRHRPQPAPANLCRNRS